MPRQKRLRFGSHTWEGHVKTFTGSGAHTSGFPSQPPAEAGTEPVQVGELGPPELEPGGIFANQSASMKKWSILWQLVLCTIKKPIKRQRMLSTVKFITMD